MNKTKTIAMILAGGQGSRLSGLTHKIAKPAVAFGGKYRLIDFTLSNCRYSNIDVVGVLTQYKPLLLNAYIGTGSSWALDSINGGVSILPPYMGMDGGNWYNGTADAVYQNIEFIDQYDPDNILILSGDHIYKMDYSKMIDFHEENNADATIAVIKVPMEEASRFGIMLCDEQDRITDFDEKPKNPVSDLASMGVYVFNWKKLKKELILDHKDSQSRNDFGKNIVPNMLLKQNKLFAYRFTGYWRDVGTVESYYQANMELLMQNPPIDLHEKEFPVFSNNHNAIPQIIGSKAKISNSLICDGCKILGTIRNSIISNGVFVEEDAVIENSIILHNAHIEKGVKIFNAIIAEGTVVKNNVVVGKPADAGIEPEIELIYDSVYEGRK
ncbi:MAG: glucose-1-phosphate adenylyltransferase [Clostridia bacterium]|nr:glucose-1-phosphate adenylyltransferase [Clostridia bacterium]